MYNPPNGHMVYICLYSHKGDGYRDSQGKRWTYRLERRSSRRYQGLMCQRGIPWYTKNVHWSIFVGNMMINPWIYGSPILKQSQVDPCCLPRKSGDDFLTLSFLLKGSRTYLHERRARN